MGDFRWIEDVGNFDVINVPKDGDLGYIVEIDMEIEEKYHDLMSDYPLAPERKTVSDEELSPASKASWKELNPSERHTESRLQGRIKTGKTMENVRMRVNIKLAHTEKKLNKYCARPSFQRFKIFNEELMGVENSKVKLLLNKPVYVGQAILDLSKVIMYEFYYKYLKPKYGDEMKLLFTDTDSFCYHVICEENIYADMHNDRHLFDVSNYPTDHLCHE